MLEPYTYFEDSISSSCCRSCCAEVATHLRQAVGGLLLALCQTYIAGDHLQPELLCKQSFSLVLRAVSSFRVSRTLEKQKKLKLHASFNFNTSPEKTTKLSYKHNLENNNTKL